jgi:pentatricopeptide repeat protein
MTRAHRSFESLTSKSKMPDPPVLTITRNADPLHGAARGPGPRSRSSPIVLAPAARTRRSLDMSRRLGPSRTPPWLKLKRAAGERLPSGSLGREDVLQLSAELLPAIAGPSPPPAVSVAESTPNWPAAGRRSRLELCKMIGERFRSGDLGPEEAPHLFDELLPLATSDTVYTLTQLITVMANVPASFSVRDGPALAISCFNRMARAGAAKVAPTIHTYSILIGCCCRVGRLDLAFASLALVIKTGWRVSECYHFYASAQHVKSISLTGSFSRTGRGRPTNPWLVGPRRTML